MYRVPVAVGLTLTLGLLLFPVFHSVAEDWPMWRHDARRSGSTTQTLPQGLSIRWVRHFPPPRPAFESARLHFDAGYEPIVQGKTLFLASSLNDSVTAYDTETGTQRWRFFAEGPIRLAPVAWKDRLFFGSDDGCVYCVDSGTGHLVWKFRAVPSRRKAIASGRMASVWPVRGGPVIAGETLYFAAGVLPFEGVFVYALKASTGEVLWLNDRCGFLYSQQPHGGRALGALCPQGYLVVNGDELIVPCGAAPAARFDRMTGKLKEFALPGAGKEPWGWFVMADTQEAKDVRRGTVLYDAHINSDRHEDAIHQGPGTPGIATKISAGGRQYAFSEEYEGIQGEVFSIVAADDKLFVVTKPGSLYCLAKDKAPAARGPALATPRVKLEHEPNAVMTGMIGSALHQGGIAVLLGLGDGDLARLLVAESRMSIVGIDSAPQDIDQLRRQFDAAGLYGTRAAFSAGSETPRDLPPYVASLVVCNPYHETDEGAVAALIREVFRCLRPYGGTACFPVPDDKKEDFARSLRKADLSASETRWIEGMAILKRVGPLPGTTNYLGNWTSPDELVGAPLGTLWFGGGVTSFKRAPQPLVVDGVMISRDKSWLGESLRMGPAGRAHEPGTGRFIVAEPEYMDVYTGRMLENKEIPPSVLAASKESIPEGRPPYQYRPPYVSKRAGETEEAGVAYPFLLETEKGRRVNPMTGLQEARAFEKSYGCEGGNDYGYLFTMRSATAAFYDKRIESGTINISGPRSGCTNSVIPANGILNVPFFFLGCSCSYPFPAGLALVKMPPEYEQWTAWGKGSAGGPIQRLGINLGAPGDRVTGAGTLWLDYPGVGGPSPELAVTVEPENNVTYFYRNALWMKGGKGWPWVCSSGAIGLRQLTIGGLKPGAYTIRLFFAEPDHDSHAMREFHISLQGKGILKGFSPAKHAGGVMRSMVREFPAVHVDDGRLVLQCEPIQGVPLLCGLELVLEGLPLDAIRDWTPEEVRPL